MRKKRFTKKECIDLADALNVNLDVVGLDQWINGMNVELEHGKVNPYTNITDDDPLMTAQIALAHLMEYPDYYDRLEKLEAQAQKYWDQRKKPDVLLP